MRRATVLITAIAFAASGIGFASPAKADPYDGNNGTINCTTGSVLVEDNMIIEEDSCAGSILIPAGVFVAEEVFLDATGLSSVYFGGDAPWVGDNAFQNVAPGAKAYIRPGATGFEAIGDTWRGLIVAEYLPDGSYLCTTGEETSTTPNFKLTNGVVNEGGQCDGIVAIPSGATSIEEGAFEGSSITSIKIPSSVSSIGDSAFFAADSLNSVYFLGNAPTVGSNSFVNVAMGAKAYIRPGATGYGAAGQTWNGLIVEEYLPNTTYLCTTGEESDELPAFTITNGVVSNGYECDGDVVIPMGVTRIAENAFKDATDISSVKIPSSATSIGESAFSGATSLSSVYFAGNAPAVASDSFAGISEVKGFIKRGATGFAAPGATWNGLTIEIYLPSGTYLCATGVESSSTPNFTVIDGVISDGKQCEGDLVIPRGISGIGSSAFNGSTSLTSVKFPASVTSIGDEAFLDATSLTSFYFLGNAPSIGTDAFLSVASGAKAYAKPGATDFEIIEGTWNGLIVEEYLPDDEYPCVPGSDSTETYTITDLVVSNGKNCIGNVVVSSGVAGIANSAFKDTTGVISITIPSSVTNIGENAFSGASSLGSIFFLGNAPTVENRAFYNIASGATAYVKSESSDSFITSGGKWKELFVDVLSPDGTYLCATGEASESTPAFTITNGVVSGGEGCEGAVIIPEGVSGIGTSAFDGSPLTSITLSSTVRSIGDNAFANTPSLERIAIPSRIASIGSDAFDGATSLSSFTVSSGNTNYSAASGVLFNKAATTLVMYPPLRNGTTYSIPASVTSIGNAAFAGTALTGITIPAGVKTIGDSAFSGATELTSINIPAGVTNIGEGVFEDTTSLTTITVASGNTRYSATAGVLFNKLATTLISYPIQKAGTSYSIPASVTSIGNKAFYNVEALSSIAIPARVTIIGGYAFAGLTSLESVTFAPESALRTIGENAFEDAETLASIILPTGVTTLGDSAFSGATALASITIPASVTGIGNGTFADATSLRSVRFLGNAPAMGSDSFSNVASDAKAYVKSGATDFELVEGLWNGLTVEEYAFVVTYNSNGGTTVDSTLFTNGGTIQRPQTPIRTGYTLAGWSRTNGGSVVAFPYSPTLSSDITLYAKWNKDPVQAAATTKPSITGKAIATAKGTNKLTANKGVWTGDPTPSFTYQWYSCTAQVKASVASIPKTCKIIAKATKPSLAVTNTLKGKFLAVAVTGKVTGTTPTVWLSKSTAKVK